MGYSPWDYKELDTTERLSIHHSQLQYLDKRLRLFLQKSDKLLEILYSYESQNCLGISRKYLG